MIDQIPDTLLQRKRQPEKDEARKHRLLKWCEARDFRPSFTQLETERERRGLTNRV